MFTYLETEKSISEKTGMDIQYPIRVFNLEGIGIDKQAFIDFLAPNYYRLEWDYYDVRKEQIDFLKSNCPDYEKLLTDIYPDYYAGKIPFSDLKEIIDTLSKRKRQVFDAIKPSRNRSVSTFYLHKEKNGLWRIEQRPTEVFTQNVDDYRAVSRIFPPTINSIATHPLFEQFLVKTAQMVEEIQPTVKTIEIINHETGILATDDRPGDNSPEGIHQDGVDYVVSALVISRKNIKGGVSTIFGRDKMTKIYSKTLQVGEGIFQADKGTELYHNVSKVFKKERKDDIGFRYILGLDINVMAK